MHRRMSFEQDLCGEVGKVLGRKLPSRSLIIDVPEPINFEVDLPVVQAVTGQTTAYRDSRSVFSRDSVGSFVRTLRSVSLFAEDQDDLIEVLGNSEASRFLTDGIG